MKGQLYVLGTTHDFQCGSANCSPTQKAAFETELRRIFQEYRIKRVAEEMDAEGLREYNVPSTIAQRLASSLPIEHHYIDLTAEERRLLSLSPGQSASAKPFNAGKPNFPQVFDTMCNEVRERCWVARILAKQQWPTLLICGADHSRNIAKLWCRFGLRVKVLHRGDYAPSPAPPSP